MTEHYLPDMAPVANYSNALIAAYFSIYWVAGLQKALMCLRAYTIRSLIVLAYTLWTLGRHGEFAFNIEWIAWGMAWCHWLGAVTNVVYPDPRFRRRKYARARP